MVKFFIVAGIGNLALMFCLDTLFYGLTDVYDFMYEINGDDLGIFVFEVNIFFTCWFATLLSKFEPIIKRHLSILLVFEMLLTTLTQLYFHHNFTSKYWVGDFMYDFKYVLPKSIILACLIYYSQLLLGRKLLPEKYRS